MSKELITSFYTAFANHDGAKMAEMYHSDAQFSDPVFVDLKGQETGAMWQMLIERSKGDLTIEFHSIENRGDVWSCVWEAKYHFSKTKRPVHNVIKASFEFQNEKIVKHTDHFDFWKWSRMALGMPGVLLGWTGFLKGKVRKQALASLNHFQNQ